MLEVDIPKIKLEIKEWEYKFLADNGRKPGHEDIKKDLNIHTKYKIYNRHKAGDKAKSKRESDPRSSQSRSHSRSYRNDPTVQYIPKSPSKISKDYKAPATPQKKGELLEAILQAKLGPTPQMNGRVLGIFDFGSPELNQNQIDSTDVIFATPSKKRVVNVIGGSENLSITSISASKKAHTAAPDPLATPSKPASTKFATPTKASPLNLQRTPIDTPTYLSQRIISFTESPMAPRRLNRSLSSIMAEIRDIKEEQQTTAFNPDDGFDLNELSDFDENELNSDTNASDHNPSQSKYRRKKTQKRTTKRVKMKPVYNSTDVVDESNRPKPLPKKQGENFQRLKLRNSGYKTNTSKLFGRRSR